MPLWSIVDCGVLGGPWDRHGPNTRSTCSSECFLWDPMVQIAADRDRTAEVDFEFDQVISGPNVCDRMALV